MATFVITTPGLPAAIFIYLKEQKQEEAIQLIRISIFERAFLMYQRAQQNQNKINGKVGLKKLKSGLKGKTLKPYGRSIAYISIRHLLNILVIT